MAKELPADLEKKLPVFPADEKGLATRQSSGKTINAIAKEVPFFYGGSADLAGSNDTLIEGGGDFEANNYLGRIFHFGIREHGMAAALNGMALHGGVIPFGATFLMFNDYMKPAYRLAHLMGVQSIFVYTHDSIGQGEDGPTHQPVETLAAMRATPNGCVIRPGDSGEVPYAWLAALQRKNAPTALVFSRQAVPTYDRTKFAPASGTLKGRLYLFRSQGRQAPSDFNGHRLGTSALREGPGSFGKRRHRGPGGQRAVAGTFRGPTGFLSRGGSASFRESQGRRGSRNFFRLAPLGGRPWKIRDVGALRRQRPRQRGLEEPGIHHGKCC